MKKYIIGAVIGAVAVLGGYAVADTNSIPYREFSVGPGNRYDVFKFVDPDNGNVCYVTEFDGYTGDAISCLKNK